MKDDNGIQQHLFTKQFNTHNTFKVCLLVIRLRSTKAGLVLFCFILFSISATAKQRENWLMPR